MYNFKLIPFIILTLHLVSVVYASGTDTIKPIEQSRGIKGTESVLNIYTWAEYIDPEIFSDFGNKFNVKIHVDYFDNENEMFSLIQSEPGRYDITFPSDSLVDWMLRANLLLKPDVRNIPNRRYIKGRFNKIINKKWKNYCMPLDWGVTGIAYNAKYIKEPVKSWNIFWNKKYKGRMALVNDGYEVMSVGLKRLGYPLNPTNISEIENASKILKELKLMLRGEGFISYSLIREWLVDENLWIAQCYNGDAALINEENNNVKFIVPGDGTSIWLDCVVIPVGAKNKRLAEEFINYMLRPEISARHTNYSYYASCNKKASIFINKEILHNPYIYLDRKIVDKLEFYETLNPELSRNFNESWAELQKY